MDAKKYLNCRLERSGSQTSPINFQAKIMPIQSKTKSFIQTSPSNPPSPPNNILETREILEIKRMFGF